MKNSLLLNKEIYSRDAIQMSVVAFRSLADISVVEEDNYYHLRFEKCRTESLMILNEFRNYVLIATLKNMGDLYD